MPERSRAPRPQEVQDLLLRLLEVDTRTGGSGASEALALVRDYLESGGVCRIKRGGDADAAWLHAQVGPETPARETSFGAQALRRQHLPQGVLLFSHVDTAGWDGSAWTHSPLGERSPDGMIYGRGALDCKSIVAVHAAVLCALAQTGAGTAYPVLRWPVGMVVTTDEERSGLYAGPAEDRAAMARFCAVAPRIFGYGGALGEGGGYILSAKRRGAITCQIGECGRLVCVARRGHKDSGPIMIGRSGAKRPAGALSRKMLARVTGVSRIADTSTIAARVQNGRVQMKVPPGASLEAAMEALAVSGLVPALDAESFERATLIHPTLSPERGRLFRAIRRTARGNGKTLIPTVTPGFGDAHFLRAAGIRTYGYFPVGSREPMTTMHGPEERIHRQTLAEAFAALLAVVVHTTTRP